MTERQHPSLAAEIESALRSAPGVRSVYRSGSLVSNLIGRGAAVLGLSTRDEPLVAVLSDGEGVSVEASIAVDGAQSTVETVRAVDMLTAYGCDVVQGYLIGMPMPIVETLQWLERGRGQSLVIEPVRV